jgi:hypothetical protein
MTKTANHPLAAAILAAGLSLFACDTHAQPVVQDELINRPINPLLCLNRPGFEHARHEPWDARAQRRCRGFGAD